MRRPGRPVAIDHPAPGNHETASDVQILASFHAIGRIVSRYLMLNPYQQTAFQRVDIDSGHSCSVNRPDPNIQTGVQVCDFD